MIRTLKGGPRSIVNVGVVRIPMCNLVEITLKDRPMTPVARL